MSTPCDTAAATRPDLGPGLVPRELISRGEVLDVHSAWSTERDCLCIVKLLRPDRRDDVPARERLRTEGRLLATLAHPHLVRAYETRETLAGPVVVMETLTGATLSHVVGEHGAPGLDADDVALLGRQLVSVLGHLHGRGLLHLDLKPSNIVVQAGRAVLIDLSLAGPPGRCAAGSGTPEYLAPEQAVGGEVGAATDVWGLGGVLYRALTGRRPFPTELDASRPRIVDPAPLVGCTTELGDLVTGCLRLDPADRPSLPELRSRLDSLTR